MRQGRISYSKVRALTRVATPDNERELLQVARAGTASHVERLVRAWRRADRAEEREREARRHAGRYLHLWTDEDGTVVLRGRLDPETGAALLRAVEAGSDLLYDADKENEATNPDAVPPAQRRADALGRVAEAALAGGLDKGTRGDRYQVVLHVDAPVLAEPELADVPVGTSDDRAERSSVPAGTPAALSAEILAFPPPTPRGDVPAGTPPEHSGAPPQSALDTGAAVPAETAQRIACDASLVRMTHDPAGNILDLGRKTRVVSPALRRALEHRDRGCRFPGCGLKFCDAHHVRHWARGGETRLENLVLLCRRHHRCVHEEGWRVEVTADGDFRFLEPAGRTVPDAPPQPRLQPDPLSALEDSLIEAGVDLEALPGEVGWDGSGLDLAWAVDALRSVEDGLG